MTVFLLSFEEGELHNSEALAGTSVRHSDFDRIDCHFRTTALGIAVATEVAVHQYCSSYPRHHRE